MYVFFFFFFTYAGRRKPYGNFVHGTPFRCGGGIKLKNSNSNLISRCARRSYGARSFLSLSVSPCVLPGGTERQSARDTSQPFAHIRSSKCDLEYVAYYTCALHLCRKRLTSRVNMCQRARTSTRDSFGNNVSHRIAIYRIASSCNSQLAGVR